MKKLSCVLVALFFVLQLAVPVFAADGAGEGTGASLQGGYSTALAGQEVTTSSYSQPYLRIGNRLLMWDNQMTGYSVKGASYNNRTKTLTLTNFSGKEIEAANMHLKVVLKGRNTIRPARVKLMAGEYAARGIAVVDGTLTVSGSGSLKMNITASNSFNFGLYAAKGVNINSGKIDIRVSSYNSICFGIYSMRGNININAAKGARVKAYAYSGRYSFSPLVGRAIKVRSTSKNVLKQGGSAGNAQRTSSISTSKGYNTGRLKCVFATYRYIQT